MRVRFIIPLLLLLSALANCAPARRFPNLAAHPQPPPLPPPAPTARIDNETFLPWASKEPTLIMVDKGCRTLSLYHYGRLIRTYPAVFGRKPGRKVYEGDQRTPTGLYMIIGKRDQHKRWARFMLLDYPTEQDVRRYWQNVSAGIVPRRGDRYRGVGGAIGIHGTDDEVFNRFDIDWTMGCVSLLNSDVKELYTFVTVGTLVYIKD